MGWLRDSGLAAAERGLGMLAGAGSFAILAHGLSPAEFGQWAMVLAAWSMFEMGREGLVQSGYLRFAAGASDDTCGRVFAAGGVLSLLVVLASVLAVPLGLPIAVPLLLAASCCRALPSMVLQGRSAFDTLCRIRLLLALTNLALLGFGALTDRLSLSWALGALCAGHVAAGLAALPQLKLRPRLDRVWVRALWDHGRYAALTRLGASLYKAMDVLMLGALAGPASAGLYSAAAKLTDYAEVPLQAISAVAQSRLSAMARRDSSAVLRTTVQLVVACTALAAVCALGLLAGGGLALQLLAGPEYAGALPAVWALSVFILLRPTERLQGVALDALGRPEANLRKVFVAVLVNALGNGAVLLWFADPVLGVAAVSTLSTAAGVLVGAQALSAFRAPAAPGARSRHSQDAPEAGTGLAL